MPPLMQMPAYQIQNTALDTEPVVNALMQNRAYGLQQDANQIKRDHLGLEQRKFARQEAESAEDRAHKEVQRIGMMSQALDAMPDGPQRRAAWSRMVQSNGMADHFSKYGIDPNDHINGPRFLIAEAGKFDPWKQKAAEAQIDSHRAAAESNRAHADYYRAGARNLEAKAQPQAAAQAVDPYAGYGLSEDGTPVPPAQQQSAPAYNFNPNDAMRMNGASALMQPPMRLGGPGEARPLKGAGDWDKYHNFKKEHNLNDVQMYQLFGSDPFMDNQGNLIPFDDTRHPGSGQKVYKDYENPDDKGRNLPRSKVNPWGEADPAIRKLVPLPNNGRMMLGGPPVDDIEASMRLDEGRPRGGPAGARTAQMAQGLPPTLMERAQQSQFGRAGMTAPEVPGIVTDAGRTRKTDVPATREMQGQRAYENAGSNEQARFAKMKQEQAFWTSAYGKPARAGYYYGPNGQELAMADKVYKGDREQQALMNMNLKVIDEAAAKLKESNLIYRAATGYANYGENARAFSDLEGAATNLAFALSGKSVSNAERTEFMNRYAPKPGDSEDTINHKVGRLKLFFNTMKEAQATGMSERDAWMKANTAVLQPNGQPREAKPQNPRLDALKNRYGLE